MDCVKLNAKVISVVLNEEKTWTLTYKDTKTGELHVPPNFDYLISATGRFTTPHYVDDVDWQPFIKKGGNLIHSQKFRSPESFRNQKVLVVGCCVSGPEIAVLISGFAEYVVNSLAHPTLVMEKVIDGKPYDHVLWKRSRLNIEPKDVPSFFEQMALRADGDKKFYGGIPVPAGSIFIDSTLALASGYSIKMLEGRLRQKPGVTGVNPDGSICFKDGTSENFDAVILATGYRARYPYLEESFRNTFDGNGNYVKLFHWTFHPQIKNFAVLGQYKGLGAYNPQVEIQARWVSQIWNGKLELPNQEEMEKWITEVLLPFENTHWNVRPHHAILEDFAIVAGVVPDPEKNPEIKDLLFDGIQIPPLYRLNGRHSKFEESTKMVKKFNNILV